MITETDKAQYKFRIFGVVSGGKVTRLTVTTNQMLRKGDTLHIEHFYKPTKKVRIIEAKLKHISYRKN